MNESIAIRRFQRSRIRRCFSLGVVLFAFGALSGIACPGLLPSVGFPLYTNTTDPTNNGATYLASTACRTCHSDIGALHSLHAHAHKLTAITDGGPAFPAIATTAGIPSPPDGFAWSDISYVLGGYAKTALFLDNDGYLLTTGLTGSATRWNLTFPPNGTVAGFAAYEPGAVAPKSYDFESFRHDTTGAVEQNPATPMFQENRPGFLGTWAEPGVQCEACHGPGSKHVPNPAARNIFVDLNGAQTCNRCHSRPFGSTTGEIPAAGGFIRDQSQYLELRASGGHSSFACGYCHDSHRSLAYDRANALRNDCTACHSEMNMALHKGKVFRRGNYEEPLTCASCHMPFATLNGSQATSATVGALGRMGDTRTHIFRINTNPVDFNGFFTADGTQVIRDAQGRAAVSVDFVCLRCHNNVGTPTLAFTVERAAEISLGLHLPYGN